MYAIIFPWIILLITALEDTFTFCCLYLSVLVVLWFLSACVQIEVMPRCLLFSERGSRREWERAAWGYQGGREGHARGSGRGRDFFFFERGDRFLVWEGEVGFCFCLVGWKDRTVDQRMMKEKLLTFFRWSMHLSWKSWVRYWSVVLCYFVLILPN